MDNYQRPYVWNDVKIRQLIDDLLEYQAQSRDAPSYYMGTLLLHRNDDHACYFVIDGQQRLTSLSVLYYVLKGEQLPVNIDFTYRSAVSAANIQKAKALFEKHAKGDLFKRIFSRLEFTVITVETLPQKAHYLQNSPISLYLLKALIFSTLIDQQSAR